MKRGISVLFAVVFLLFFVFFCVEERIIVIPDEPQCVCAECVQDEYILNTGSKKIHKKTCSSAARIHDVNRQQYDGSVIALFDEGYSFCKNCFK